MVRRTSIMISTATVAGVLLGGVAGYFLPELMTSIDFVGQLFTNALRLILIPLIISSIIVGVAGLGEIRKAGRTVARTVIYFAATTAVAVCIGIALVNVIGPGIGVDNSASIMPDQIRQARQVTAGELISNLIPVNPVGAVMASRYLGIIIFALLFGAVLTTMGNRKRAVVEFFRGVQEAIVKLINLIIYAAPVGLFFLVGSAVARNVNNVPEMFQGVLPYILVLMVGFLIHGMIVLPLILKYFAHRSPLEYFGKLIPAVTTALGTGSTSVTLPITYDCVVNKSYVDSRAGSMVLPLGTTMNLNATSMYVAVVALFVGQSIGFEIGVMQVILIGLVAVLASFGTAGIPGASLFMLVLVFDAAGFPEQAYAGLGLVVVAEWFVDRCRAAVNVWGDAVGAAVIAQQLKNDTSSRSRSGESSQRSTRRPARPTRREGEYNKGTRQSGSQYGSREYRGKGQVNNRQRDHESGKDRNNRNVRNKYDRRSDGDKRQTKPSPFEINTKQIQTIDLEEPKAQPATTEKRGRNGRKPIASSTESRSERKPYVRKEVRTPSSATTSGNVHKSKPVRSSNRETTGKTVSEPIKMTESTIERERSRLESQLTEMKKKEEQRKSTSKPSDSRPTVEQPMSSSGKSATSSENVSSPRIDYSAESITPKPSPDSKSSISSRSITRETSSSSDRSANTNIAVPSEKPVSVPLSNGTHNNSKTEKQVTAYGRTRNRRDGKPQDQHATSKDTTSKSQTKESSNDEPTFDVQSFGRAKKKRTRR